VGVIDQSAGQIGRYHDADGYVISSRNGKDDDEISDHDYDAKGQSFDKGTAVFFLKSHGFNFGVFSCVIILYHRICRTEIGQKNPVVRKRWDFFSYFGG
jgi:hypothetical protein